MQYIEQPHASLPDFIGRFVLNSDIEETGKSTVALTCCYRSVEPSGCICDGIVDEISLVGAVIKDGDVYLAFDRRSDRDSAAERLAGRFRNCRDALLAIAEQIPTLSFDSRDVPVADQRAA
jgi:hypothetical protein